MIKIKHNLPGANTTLQEKITIVYLLLMSLMFLLKIPGSSYPNIINTKYSFFLFICGGYCVLSLFVMFLQFISKPLLKNTADNSSNIAINRTSKNPLKKSVPYVAFAVSVSAYGLFTVISSLMSSYSAASVVGIGRNEGSLTIIIYCIICLLICNFASGTDNRFSLSDNLLTRFLAISIIIFDIIAFIQFAGFNPLEICPDNLTYYDKYLYYSGAFISTIGNADQASAFLALTIPFFLVLFVGAFRHNRENRFSAILYGTCTLLSIAVAVIYSQTAIGICAAITVIAIFLPLMLCRNKKTAAACYAVIAVVLIVFLIFVFAFGSSTSGTIYELHEIMHGNLDDAFGNGRLYIYKNILPHIPENLLWGTGPDTLYMWNIQPFIKYDSAIDSEIVAIADNAHCEFLNIAACQGLLALISYISVLTCALVLFIKSKKSLLSLACAAAVTGYLLQSVFSFSMFTTAPYFWIMLGLTAGLSISPAASPSS